MSAKPTLLILIAIALSATLLARASDVYVLRFSSPGAMLNACTQLGWSDQLFFHNPAATPAIVKLVNATYSLPGNAAPQIVVPSGVTRLSPAANWDSPNPFLGVAHLDVPDGVDVVSKTEPSVFNCTGICLCPPTVGFLGGVPQKVYRQLVPANTPDIHIGTELPALASHTNVTVYNAGTEFAIATVEIHQVCDDALLTSVQMTIPANSVATASGLTAAFQTCSQPQTLFTPPSAYVRVISTQTGLSWVTSLANDLSSQRPTIISN